jgi:hypothetical protein
MFFDLPYGAKVDKYMAGMQTTDWLTWTNPRNEYSNAIILAAGGGGSGGTTGGGGGGAFAHIYCPLSLLPDNLYIQVALGGSGGNAGNSTYINLYPSIQTSNNLITCGGGAGGFNTVSGGSVTINNTVGIVQGYTGGSGTNTATSSLPITGSPIYGGAGRSLGTGALSGGMTSVSSLYPSVTGSINENGKDGFVIWKPFTVFGGCGGGAGFSGGNGIMGSGGGGGSAGGGKGGDGFVIIICY